MTMISQMCDKSTVRGDRVQRRSGASYDRASNLAGAGWTGLATCLEAQAKRAFM